MKKIFPQPSRRWLTGAAAGLVAFTPGAKLSAAVQVLSGDLPLRRAADLKLFSAGYDYVLGTSLDLFVEAARPRDAAECEARILGEIERLRGILSTYDPASEISRVLAGAPVASVELAELLAVYETWSTRTQGLITPRLGGVIVAWREAARTGQLPEAAALTQAARRARAFNVDALGKSFIIDRAVAVARRFASGGLINLGGDIRAWGDSAWTIGVADPRNPADNAAPLTRFTLRDAAVATSGGYARFFDVGGRRFSHLIDPRTLWPCEAGGSATVVARDCVTANALSTAASIGGPAAGATLAAAHGATGYLFGDAAGNNVGGGLIAPAAANGLAPAPSAAPVAPQEAPVAAAHWPAGFQLTLPVILKKHAAGPSPGGGPRPKEIYRPYVVVWVEDAKGKVVRTITVWGTDERYQRKLTTWTNELGRSNESALVTARATRPPGSYTVVWDGKDDVGRRLPMGTYKISLELCREEGHHVFGEATVHCTTEPVTASMTETAESDASTVAYGLPPT